MSRSSPPDPAGEYHARSGEPPLLLYPDRHGEAPGWGVDLLPNTRSRIRAGFGLIGLLFVALLAWGLYITDWDANEKRQGAKPSWAECLRAVGDRPEGAGEPQRPTMRRQSVQAGFVVVSGALLGLLACAAVWLVAPRVSAGSAIRLALWMQPVVCLAIGLGSKQGLRLVPFGWAGILIAVFPFLVPVDRRRLLWSSILSAATIPLSVLVSGLLVCRLTGRYRGYPGTEEWIVMGATSLLFVGVAYWATVQQRTLLDSIRRLRGYRLERRLGRGGMGEVWLARRALLRAPVAIKVLHPGHLLGRELEAARLDQARFWQEAETTAGLQSPHTARTLDLGVSREGELYMVMEFLEGITFGALMKDTPLAPRRAADLFRQVCDSLEEAHGRGLLHRDVKPSNLMLCRYAGREDFVKVLDFGLGLIAHSELIRRHESPEHRIGTLGWMAPELWRGEEPDPRSDLYSLGAVMFAVFCGGKPFAGDEADLECQHLDEQRRPSPAAYGVELPAPIEALLADCLQVDRERRPASAAEVRERLGELRQ